MGQRTSVYLDDDLHAAVKASDVPLAELVRRGLAASSASEEPVPAQPAASSIVRPPGRSLPRRSVFRCRLLEP
jgi:hypothetical protein